MIATVVFVDDDADIRQSVKRSLRDEPYRLVTVDSARACLEALAAVPTHVVVSDLRMPGVDGEKLLTHIMQTRPEIVRIVLSGALTLPVALDAINRCQVFRCLEKPCSSSSLALAIREALSYAEMVEQTRRLLELVQMQANFIAKIDQPLPEKVGADPIEGVSAAEPAFELSALINDALAEVEAIDRAFIERKTKRDGHGE